MFKFETSYIAATTNTEPESSPSLVIINKQESAHFTLPELIHAEKTAIEEISLGGNEMSSDVLHGWFREWILERYQGEVTLRVFEMLFGGGMS